MDQINISIIVPVYNGEETLEKCLISIEKIKYSKDLYEVILINDGSTDKTLEIAEKFKFIKITNLPENQGRLVARKTGAQTAKFDELLFVDSRIEISENILTKRNEINYSPLMAGDLSIEKYSSDFDTLFYLVRKKIYAPYYPQTNYGTELWIDKKNFFNSPKGTGCFFIPKVLFLDSLPNNLSKDTNDDTKIMKSIVSDHGVKILRHTEIKLNYHQRTNNNIYAWIHHRGKIWADHYLTFLNVYSAFYTIFSIIFILALIFSIKFLFLYLILAFVLSGIFLAENIKDFIIIIKTLPILAIRFHAGTIQKLIQKYLYRNLK